MVFGSLATLVHFSPHWPIARLALYPPMGGSERILAWTLSTLRPPVKYTLIGVAMAVVFAQLSQRPNLDAFPTVGTSRWFHSWCPWIKYIINPADLILEGYKKYNGAPFKISTLYHWVVIITNRTHIEELRSARDDEFSLLDASNEDFNFDFTLGSKVARHPDHTSAMPPHMSAIPSRLTRNIGVLYSELRDEVVAAFEEVLDLQDNEWKCVPALSTIKQVVCRANNRTFVGLPLCRDPGFVALNVQFTIDAMVGGIVIGFFPKFLRPLAVLLFTNVPRDIRKGVQYLRPIIEERRKYWSDHGNDLAERPNDLLSWLMDEVGPNASVQFLTNLFFATNLPAIHSTSNVFTNALFNIAANPHYAQLLREEVEMIVEKEGWSKSSLSKMRRVDSFLKESLRMEGVDVLSLVRKAVKDFRFSDGTVIPKGTRINAGLVALHSDDALYENASVFDPLRFVGKNEADDADAKHQLVVTSPEYLAFGHGRYACPGRFFAAAELKTMLAHIVMTYDLRLEENMTRPSIVYIGSLIYPSATAKVMFRRRRTRDGNECPLEKTLS